jgi:FMN reductase [NAD(P)H]
VTEFRDLLPKRRMVRHYGPDPVPQDVVERVVSTVRRAPSAGYSQGQRLLVLTGDEGRATVIRCFASSGWGDSDGLEPWFESAPVHVLVCTREDDYHDRYRRDDKLDEDGREIDWPVPYWFVDAGAALMLLLLAAIDEGLGAGVSGVPREVAGALRAELGMPDDVTVVALVTMGVAAPDPGWSSVTSRRTQPRRAQGDLVHWERWTPAGVSESRSP